MYHTDRQPFITYSPVYPKTNQEYSTVHNMERSCIPDGGTAIPIADESEIYPKIDIDEEFTSVIDTIDDHKDDKNYTFKPTAPIDNRPNSENSYDRQGRPFVKKKWRLPPIFISNCLIFVLNAIVFTLLMWFRKFDTPQSLFYPDKKLNVYKTVAKNSALMTVLNLSSVFYSLSMRKRRCHIIFAMWFVVFALTHVISHVMLGLQHNITHYITRYMFFTLSGIVILSTLVPLCVSRCLRNYSHFYVVHTLSTVLMLFSSVTHSYWFALSFAYPIMIFGIRVLRRWLLNIELRPITVGDTFIFFELMIKDTFVNRCLALNYLKKHNGNVVAWLSRKHANSIFERHPFSILKTYNKCGQSNSQIIMSKFGDWKSEIYASIRANYSKSLYSCGVECYLDEFTNDKNLKIYKNYSHILFILENLDVARFLSFVTLINDPRNRKLRTIVRQIELHFKFDDYLLHDIIREYTFGSLINSQSSSFNLNINFYYVCDLNSPELKDKIYSPYVRYFALKRLNHTRIVQKFVSRYYTDKLDDKRSDIKIVSSEERKVKRAVKHITAHKKTTIVI